MQLLKGESLQDTAHLYLMYIILLHISFYYLHKKTNQNSKGGQRHCLEVSALSKTVKTRVLTACLGSSE